MDLSHEPPLAPMGSKDRQLSTVNWLFSGVSLTCTSYPESELDP